MEDAAFPGEGLLPFTSTQELKVWLRQSADKARSFLPGDHCRREPGSFVNTGEARLTITQAGDPVKATNMLRDAIYQAHRWLDRHATPGAPPRPGRIDSLEEAERELSVLERFLSSPRPRRAGEEEERPLPPAPVGTGWLNAEAAGRRSGYTGRQIRNRIANCTLKTLDCRGTLYLFDLAELDAMREAKAPSKSRRKSES